MTDQTIGHYKILDKLGEGGMGVVYKAHDTHLDRFVAIKVLPAEKVTNPERKRRFVQEAKAASALNHPNIITIYDIGSDNGCDFIAMEFVNGKTLEEWLGQKGLRLGETLKVAVQIADALATAHAAGIIHRDLKPGNVMVTEVGLVKVLDFGLAKLMDMSEGREENTTRTMAMDAAPSTELGAIVGTVAYMSPEQAEGKTLDGRSDIFSFGSVLYEMATHRRAFQGETRMSTLSAILRGEPKPVSDASSSVPRELEKIINRCLRKDPARRFQHMGDLKVELEELKEDSDSGKLALGATAATNSSRRSLLGVILTAGALLAAMVIGIAWWLNRSPKRVSAPVLTRLTSDSGLTTDPALSPDGKLVAYASDRSGEGNLDLWVQQVAGGDAIRLTRHPADDREPAFSPDGSKLVFSSEREGGGIYAISSFGGEAKRIADGGHNPQFSPDGKRIVYWTGERYFATLGEVYVVASTGGAPTALQTGIASARYPIWTPDGQHLLFLGRQRPDIASTSDDSADWWVAAVSGSAAVRTGAFDVFRGSALDVSLPDIAPIAPGGWIDDQHYVVFGGRSGASQNLWRIPLSRTTWHVLGAPERVTFGSGLEAKVSATADGRIAFVSLNENDDLWLLPIDANKGKVQGELQRLTEDASPQDYPSLSADGKKLAFNSYKSGHRDVWMRDLVTGKETTLANNPIRRPVFSADGSKVAYSMLDNQKWAIVAVESKDGVVKKLCEDCGEVFCWSPDGQTVFYVSGQPGRIYLLNVTSGEKRELIRHSKYSVIRPSVSSDGRWISFHAQMSPLRRQIFIVPLRDGKAPQESEWIPVTDGSGLDREAFWSPDGNSLYFLSERDGSRCIWVQRLEPKTKRPLGRAFPVYHSHSSHRSLMNLTNSGAAGPAVSRGKLVFAQREITGNIWMIEPQK